MADPRETARNLLMRQKPNVDDVPGYVSTSDLAEWQKPVPGNGVGLVGKALGAIGLDASGERAAQSWGDALKTTAHGFAMMPQTAVEGAHQAYTYPSRVARGEASPYDAAEVLNFTGNVTLGGATAPKPTNAAGMFGGRLAETADRAALARAEEMAAKGTPREKIWNETGWFQGPDTKWRFEVDDSPMRVAPSPDWAPATEHYRHPGLAAAYPGTADIESLISTTSGSTRASYYADSPPMMTVAAPSAMAARGAALHEMQHFLQGVEGFEGGGTPEIARTLPQYRDAMGGFEQQAASRGLELDSGMRQTAEDRLARAIYRRLAGEVEARNVERRMDMTVEQRRALPPWRTIDVPEQEIIASTPWSRR